MLFGKRGPRILAARRRGEFQPKLQSLEERCLMAIDLGGVLPPGLPNVATQPYGIDLAGGQSSGAAGFSVTDVGDTNKDGFDDFVVGAPTGVNIGGQIQPGTGSNSRAYLVFGSLSVNAGNVDWLTLNAVQRVGDLNQLGNSPAAQQNPITGQSGFAYAGVSFLTSQTSGSQLGASVAAAGDVNGDGFADFLIGAPNERDANGLNPGTGRAYLVFGGTGLTGIPNNTVDLDNPTGATGVTVLTFTSTIANSHVGRSVAGIGSFLATGTVSPDIAIGAPDASLAGQIDNGAVYVIPGSVLAGAGSGTINLNAVGQSGGIAGVTFAGSTAGEEIGLSLAGAGNVNGAISGANQSIGDLLIGAPNANGLTGLAFLVYGGTGIPGSATVVNGTRVIQTNRVGGTATNGVAGATFVGSGGSRAGWAVSTIGDYNGDGFADIAIGAPFAAGTTGSQSGRVFVFYGQPATGTTLTGTIPLNNLPSGVPELTLNGAAPGALAGYSLSISGKVNAGETGNDFLVGSPGLNGNQGGVYFFPANPFFVTGNFQLVAAESQPLAGTLIQITNTPNGAPAFLGASVAGRLTVRGQTRTADNDNQADFILGAPGYGVTSARVLDGGVFIMEGKFLPVQTPINTAIQTQIGVGQPFGPFIINASNPASLAIYVFSNNTLSPPFQPVTQIDPTTIVVNGVPFSNATIAADPVDENKDGIPDAIITITPRSRINLQATSTTFTITGRTLTNSVQGGKAFSGTAAITVSGGVTPPVNVVVGVTSGIQTGTILPTSFTPHFGPDQFVPPITALSAYDYKPIPYSVAYQQYLPGPGFALRMKSFQHPLHLSRVSGNQNSLRGRLSPSLDSHVFTRSKFHGKTPIAFHHVRPVIPTNRQNEEFLPPRKLHSRVPGMP